MNKSDRHFNKCKYLYLLSEYLLIFLNHFIDFLTTNSLSIDINYPQCDNFVKDYWRAFMKNYNQPNPDVGFITTVRNKITALPLITFICFIFLFPASFSIMRGGIQSLFTLIVVLCVCIVLPFYYFYLLLRAFTEMLIVQNKSLETLDKIYDKLDLLENPRSNSARQTIDEELPEI